MQQETGIARAISAATSQKALGEALGVTQQVVSSWLAQGFVPAGRAAEIEHQFGVPRGELISPKIKNLIGANGGEL